MFLKTYWLSRRACSPWIFWIHSRPSSFEGIHSFIHSFVLSSSSSSSSSLSPATSGRRSFYLCFGQSMCCVSFSFCGGGGGWIFKNFSGILYKEITTEQPELFTPNDRTIYLSLSIALCRHIGRWVYTTEPNYFKLARVRWEIHV